MVAYYISRHFTSRVTLIPRIRTITPQHPWTVWEREATSRSCIRKRINHTKALATSNVSSPIATALASIVTSPVDRIAYRCTVFKA